MISYIETIIWFAQNAVPASGKNPFDVVGASAGVFIMISPITTVAGALVILLTS